MARKPKTTRAMNQGLTELARGFRRRTLPTLRLASKLGLGMARKNLGMDDIAREVDEDAAVEAATELLNQLDGLKGLVMKFGQMASYLSPTLPPKAQRVLARLQSQSQPMVYERIAAVVEAELGAPPEQAFESFEREPFAAASIGQVHRAVVGGTSVAVKVQYPGVDNLLEADFKTVGRLMRLGLMLAPMDARALMDELRDRIREECDYRSEAGHQTQFARLFEDIPDASVPAVIDSHSSGRVLTSELVSRAGFEAFCDAADHDTRSRAGAVIFGTAFECMFRHCTYNADPHPGNYLFSDDGAVTFLDFGCVKKFPREFIDTWKRLAVTVLDGDREGFPDALVATGMVGRRRKFDFDYQWRIFQYLYEPFLSHEPFTFTHEYVRRSYDLMIFRNPNKFRTGLPPDWLFVNRLQWGMNSVLAHLGATRAWGELFRRAVESPTEPVG